MRVGVLGYGQEGQAIADYLIAQGVMPIIYDAKSLEQLPTEVLAKLHHNNLKFNGGDNYLNSILENCNIIFRSPGIKIPPEFINESIEKSITITSQTAWFFTHCPAKIIGVTGTKGKGTTSSLISEILVKAKEQHQITGNVYLTGNIGKVQPLSFLDDLTENDLIVYELSSFQLQDLKTSPHLGICLMVTEDHLDYHKNLNEYYEAKSAISKYQTGSDILIYNTDYEASKKIAQSGNGTKWVVSKNSLTTNGVQITDESLIVRGVENSDIVIDTNRRLLRGKHNLENIAAASLAGLLLGVTKNVVEQSIVEFKGLKHRLQFVKKIEEVSYFNDSISTIPETTIAALQSFNEPVILLLGGASKNLNYNDLVLKLNTQTNLKAVVTVGQTGEDIFQKLKSLNFNKTLLGPFFNFKEAVESAKALAISGDVVLLSPAATSFDMFKSYADRGDQFIKIVEQF